MSVVLAAALGAVTWSLLEYVIHRWLGHDRRLLRNVFGREHTQHHAKGHYFAPAWKKAAAAVVTSVLLGVPAVLVAGPALGGAWTAGLVGFYLTYEVIHRRLHVSPGWGPYARWARRHHFYHHFHDPSVNHGVTSPVWDVVFGTRVTVTAVDVPERLAMPWLLDAETGDVRAGLDGVWRLKRPQRAEAADVA